MGRRPNNDDRPAQGAHLLKLRLAAGLTQAELAAMVEDTKSNIAFWEKSEKPPRSDVLPKLAEVLGVSVDQLLRPHAKPRQQAGPVGRLQRVFYLAAELPRSQQDKVVDVLESLIRGMHGAS